jgi:CubicO group peptidase (beta-lactamase class C family)
MKSPRTLGRSLLLGSLAVMLLMVPAPVAADDAASTAAAIARIMETFGTPVVDRGAAVGIAVGVTYRGRPPQFFSYGTANVTTSAAVTPDTIFQMGSVTKVFTTALLGEAVLAGQLKLNLPLSRLQPLVGTMLPSTQLVTLLNLGDFTAGLPVSTPPKCFASNEPPGCVPNGRPTISEYGAQDLLDYYRAFNAPRMPGPYFYSDISTGLIGLILGSNLNAPMGDDAVQNWFDLVEQRITEPLGMTSTSLFPPNQAPVAGGYDQPVVDAMVSGGGLVISSFTGGKGYLNAPPATVVGGGGSGATAATTIDGNGNVTSVYVTNPGQGYLTAAKVTVSSDVANTAEAKAIIANGQVVGISILNRGTGFSPKHPPVVTVTGGNYGPGARNAILGTATVSNGGLDFVPVIDGGAGYVDPIAVVVAPGPPANNNVPIWAPAGALKSSARDMISFAEAALGHSTVNGVRVDPKLRSAFQMAQKSYACANSDKPCLDLSGLAWAGTPADGGMPAIVSKNGGLPGFSTELRLMPNLDLGVIVFINTNDTQKEDGKKPPSTSGLIADNIMYAIARSKLP